MREHTIYAAVVGSRAFGLDTDDSDTDTRGVYVAPTEAFWSLAKPPAHVDGPEPEWFSWEVERFCELALKSNPNLLEVLHSRELLLEATLVVDVGPHRERATPDVARVDGWLWSDRRRSLGTA